MYKVLLCWRYLRTRFLALVCIVSVMLGVATLIVVNSVMSGFSTKLRERLHGLLCDVVLEAYSYDGFSNPEGKMEMINADPFLRDRIVAMTPTLEIFAMFQYRYNGHPFTHAVRLIGIDPEGRAKIGGFSENLVSETNKNRPSFALSPAAVKRYEQQRRARSQKQPAWAKDFPAAPPTKPKLPSDWPEVIKNLDKVPAPPPVAPTPERPHIPQGIFVGFAIANIKTTDPDTGEPLDVQTLKPGDIVTVMTLNSQYAPVDKHFVVADYFRSEMSEYDGNYCFVDLKELQKLRAMENRATSIQIRLKDYRDAPEVVARLKKMFAGLPLEVQTWEDKQGPLLSAISVEKGILNVLLFMIIAVAGFGILAIFSMIVVEKTRDIGILKALGASNMGILKIFLGYGLLLGMVGSGLGTLAGLLFAYNINPIEQALTKLTGGEIFPRTVYYFKDIPTDIQPMSVFWINLGAIGIAVMFSVLPALRAALLHPVRALRYE